MSKKVLQTPTCETWLTKQQAAQFLQVAEKTIDRLAERNEIQKASRKRPGLAPVAVFHPGDLERIKAERNQAPAPFVVPANADLQIAKQPEAAGSLVKALTAIAERVTAMPAAELKEPYFLTLKEARETSGLPISFLRSRFIDAGLAVKTGGGWRIARAELERFAREQFGQVSDVSKKVRNA